MIFGRSGLLPLRKSLFKRETESQRIKGLVQHHNKSQGRAVIRKTQVTRKEQPSLVQ